MLQPLAATVAMVAMVSVPPTPENPAEVGVPAATVAPMETAVMGGEAVTAQQLEPLPQGMPVLLAAVVEAVVLVALVV